MASWRNGSAFDSRSKGYPFKSGWGQFLFFEDFPFVLGVSQSHGIDLLSFSLFLSSFLSSVVLVHIDMDVWILA